MLNGIKNIIMLQNKFEYDVSIIGGVGHIGLPLGLLLKKQKLIRRKNA